MKTLKTLKFALVCGIVLNTFVAMANTAPATNTINAGTEKTIRDYFKFPQVLLPHALEKAVNNKVEVVFTTDNFGKVNFVLAKTDDKMLRQEIERQFLGLRLTQLKQNVAHSVTLNFRTL